MILDYIAATNVYVLKAPRGTDVNALVQDHGLDFSTTDSSESEAVLGTRDPFAAVSFWECATPRAKALLENIHKEIVRSRAKDWRGSRFAMPAGQELWPFQNAAVDYVLKRPHALIGDSPGLGKTPTAVVVANEIQAKNVLVVCPASIRLQWARVIRQWTTMQGRFVVYPIMKAKDGVHPTCAWTIVSYDLLRSKPIMAALMKRRFDLLILDEGHYLKTPSALRTQAVFGHKGVDGLAERAERVLALTGTPLPNRPRECYTLARGLCWDAIDWMSEDAFQHRYNPNRFYIEKRGRLPELRNRLRYHFMVRRQKRDVLDQLPQIRFELVHIDPSGDVKKALEAESMLHIDPENLGAAGSQLKEIIGHISVVRRMMGVAKAPQVADYVSVHLEGGVEKIVVFAWHIEVMDILEKALAKWGVCRIDGSVPTARRQILVDEFVHDPKKRVFLGNMQAMGVGVDGLQKVCSHAVFAEASWTPSDVEQAVGRLERIGQSNAILVEFLVAPGSFDDRVLGSMVRKLRDIHVSLDKKEH